MRAVAQQTLDLMLLGVALRPDPEGRFVAIEAKLDRLLAQTLGPDADGATGR